MFLIVPARYFFFFNDTATTEIYTLSLHDALPIWMGGTASEAEGPFGTELVLVVPVEDPENGQINSVDRKSTRLNSSHANISYAVFCLKKKNSLLAQTLDEMRRVLEREANAVDRPA